MMVLLLDFCESVLANACCCCCCSVINGSLPSVERADTGAGLGLGSAIVELPGTPMLLRLLAAAGFDRSIGGGGRTAAEAELDIEMEEVDDEYDDGPSVDVDCIIGGGGGREL